MPTLRRALTASDPVAKLGERLSIFYGTGNGRDYSGAYSGTSEFAMKSKGVQAPISSDIVISADVGFWRVTEKTESVANHVIFDGVLVCSGEAAVVVLKDRLAGLPRSYILDEFLIASGVTASFKSEDIFKVDVKQLSLLLRRK